MVEWLKPIETISILTEPTMDLGARQTILEADQLDDEALETIMNPITANKREIEEQEPLLNNAQSEKKTVKGTIFD